MIVINESKWINNQLDKTKNDMTLVLLNISQLINKYSQTIHQD